MPLILFKQLGRRYCVAPLYEEKITSIECFQLLNWNIPFDTVLLIIRPIS